MAQKLGLSRVAFWKRIQNLRSLGYKIIGGPKGYFLTEDDVLESWEFPESEGPVHHWTELTSTMDKAWELAHQGAQSGTLVIADSQTAGRGQENRQWISDLGNLHFTLITKPSSPINQAGPIVIESLYRLCNLIQQQTGIPLKWKWPNDLLCHNQKVGGILAEGFSTSGKWTHILIGVGINFKEAPSLDKPTAALEHFKKQSIPRRPLVRNFRSEILGWINNPIWEKGRWEQNCSHQGTWRSILWDGRNASAQQFKLDQKARIITSSEENISWGETKTFEGVSL